MSLSACFDTLEVPTRTITVYAPPPRPTIVDRLASETNLDAVTYRSLPAVSAADDAFVVVHEDDAFAVAIGLDGVRQLFEPSIHDPWTDDHDRAFRRATEVFGSTVWHALERRQLLAVSREIETRAWRIGDGTLRVGFQRADALAAMAPMYDRLGRETSLDIHVYVADEWGRPDLPSVEVHAEAGDEIGAFWFLAFDGAGDELWTSGLLAREIDDDTYEGYWTDDDRLVATLERAIVETAG